MPPHLLPPEAIQLHVDCPVDDVVSPISDDLTEKDKAQKIAKQMSALAVGEGLLLRATKPASALWCFGRVLQEGFVGDLYHFSFETENIECFWSHSWHATAWEKILVLLVVYNGRAAIVSGTLAAVLGMSLFYLRILPGYPRFFGIEEATYDCGPWGLSIGCLVTSLVFLLWRPGGSIFLDRICISQSDPELKHRGIRNLGSFLQRSQTMLVLFDPTYPTRLWTIFELAAFLQSHTADDLVIRPGFLGTAAVLIFLLAACVITLLLHVATAGGNVGRILLLFGVTSPFFFAVGVHWARGYFRHIDEALLQLQTFCLKEAQCHCCSVNHVDPSGESMVCDREIIMQCIRTWFGSEEDFEARVRASVPPALLKGVGRYAFPLGWFFCASLPVCWALADLVVARLRAQDFYYSWVGLIHLFLRWLALGFWGYFATFSVAYLLRGKWSGWLDCCVSFLMSTFVHGMGVVVHLAGRRLTSLVGDELLGAILWCAMAVGGALLSWKFWLRIWPHGLTGGKVSTH